MIGLTKVCTRCHIEKPLSKFAGNGRCGTSKSQCNTCINKLVQERRKRRPELAITVTHRVCWSCHVDKPAHEFGRGNKIPGGIAYQCKACRNEQARHLRALKRVLSTPKPVLVRSPEYIETERLVDESRRKRSEPPQLVLGVKRCTK